VDEMFASICSFDSLVVTMVVVVDSSIIMAVLVAMDKKVSSCELLVSLLFLIGLSLIFVVSSISSCNSDSLLLPGTKESAEPEDDDDKLASDLTLVTKPSRLTSLLLSPVFDVEFRIIDAKVVVINASSTKVALSF